MSAHYNEIKEEVCGEEECTGCHPELLNQCVMCGGEADLGTPGEGLCIGCIYG